MPRPQFAAGCWWVVAATGCASGDELSQSIACGQDGSCSAGYSCLVTECTKDGSIAQGGTCNRPEQCQEGLTCVDFACVPGCPHVYRVDDCEQGMWCKPGAGGVGQCSLSECDPGITEFCTTSEVCVAFAAETGGCLPYCEYGYASSTYRDGCTDDAGTDRACQPLGLNQAPVCLPSGDMQVGEAGCDAVEKPCDAGFICVDVVCRRLCADNQREPCGVGEDCVAHAGRTDVSYCLAD
ncbi:MAG: hypothetical protein HYZ27_04945 [Deltaproteobacteria bacterium]|nr:hypothetical protein [Deltaproteobacteria bacterium]